MPKIKIPPKTAGSWSKIDANNSEEPVLLSSLSLHPQKPSTTPQGPSFLSMNGASPASAGGLPDPFTLLTKKEFPVSATTDVENVFGVSGQAAEPHQTFHMATSSLYITAHDLHRYQQYTGIVIVRLLGLAPSDLNSDNRGAWLEKNNIDYYIVLPLLDVAVSRACLADSPIHGQMINQQEITNVLRGGVPGKSTIRQALPFPSLPLPSYV